jgi:hypothetical protein
VNTLLKKRKYGERLPIGFARTFLRQLTTVRMTIPSMSELVKLYIYQHHPEETVIDTVTAIHWDDILIVRASPSMTLEEHENLNSEFGELAAKNPGKQIVLIANDLPVDFYGVRVDESA